MIRAREHPYLDCPALFLQSRELTVALGDERKGYLTEDMEGAVGKNR